ncbi:MAG: magnesium transporter [Clostridia bacterium]|nr:magnesium transporter [Clostridia bacterium]
MKNTEEIAKITEEPLDFEKNPPDISLLISMIEEKRFSDFVSEISSLAAADVAPYFDKMPKGFVTRFFRLLPKELAAEAFVLIDSDVQELIINSFNDSELSEMLSELYLDDTVDIIEEMPANVVKRILRSSSGENRREINELLGYPRDSAGTIMTTEYVRFTGDMTVEAALAHIRRVAIDKETIYTCYVTDSSRHLEGIVTAKQLLISPLETKLSEIMESSVIFSSTHDDKEEVAEKINKYGFLSLPIVDNEKRLVGIVTVDDAIEVLKEEVEEDISKMAAITPVETPYLKTPVLSVFKSRIPWLLLLMVSATVSSTILSRFEQNLASILVLFVPMLMDTGGNCGNQASVTLVRGLSLGEVKLSDFLKVWWRELRVGMLCGITLAAVAFCKIMLVDHLIMQNSEVTVVVAAVVAVTLAITIIIAKFVGSTLPIIASKIGLDPAVMASPFITTSVDALSLLVYFFIALPFFPK